MQEIRFCSNKNIPLYMRTIPCKIEVINGRKYWVFDYDSKEAKEMNLNAIQKINIPA